MEKAFDKINHKLLINELKSYGFNKTNVKNISQNKSTLPLAQASLERSHMSFIVLSTY